MIDRNDPRLTTYALDELTGLEREEVAQAVTASRELQAEVDAIRAVASKVSGVFDDDTLLVLSDEQRRGVLSGDASAPNAPPTPATTPAKHAGRRLAMAGIGISLALLLGVTIYSGHLGKYASESFDRIGPVTSADRASSDSAFGDAASYTDGERSMIIDATESMNSGSDFPNPAIYPDGDRSATVSGESTNEEQAAIIDEQRRLIDNVDRDVEFGYRENGRQRPEITIPEPDVNASISDDSSQSVELGDFDELSAPSDDVIAATGPATTPGFEGRSIVPRRYGDRVAGGDESGRDFGGGESSNVDLNLPFEEGKFAADVPTSGGFDAHPFGGGAGASEAPGQGQPDSPQVASVTSGKANESHRLNTPGPNTRGPDSEEQKGVRGSEEDKKAPKRRTTNVHHLETLTSHTECGPLDGRRSERTSTRRNASQRGCRRFSCSRHYRLLLPQ